MQEARDYIQYYSSGRDYALSSACGEPQVSLAGALDESDARRIAGQLCDAIAYLHSLHIVRRHDTNSHPYYVLCDGLAISSDASGRGPAQDPLARARA